MAMPSASRLYNCRHSWDCTCGLLPLLHRPIRQLLMLRWMLLLLLLLVVVMLLLLVLLLLLGVMLLRGTP